MARVMITCPDTGKAVYTGISLDEITFENTHKVASYRRHAERCTAYSDTTSNRMTASVIQLPSYWLPC